MTLDQIYDELFAGKKATLAFPNKKEAESFRVSLAQYKSVKDKQLVSIGLVAETEVSSLGFTYNPDSQLAVIEFKPRRVLKDYQVIIDG